VPPTSPQAEGEAVAGMPAAIEGLDMAAGLRRVLGKQARYVAMLRGFAATQDDAAAQISHALEQQDRNTAERLAHTLKGLAGNIGAVELQQRSEKLETAIRRAEQVQELLPMVEAELAARIAAILSALPPEAKPQLAEADLGRVAEIGEELGKLLADDDARAEKLLNQHEAVLNAAFPQQFRQLADAVRQFDFEQALAILTGALAALPQVK
jgi:HPt (histidine-containing phosphotransfer) domain-containing protein